MMTDHHAMEEPKPYMNKSLLTHIGKLALIFLVHFGSGVLALSSELVVFAETLTWLPAGVALAAFLLWGSRMWPAIAAGAVAISFYDSAPWQSAVVSAVANVTGPLVSSWMLRRLSFQPALQRIRDVVQLALIGSLVGPLITATVGAVTLKAIGRFANTPLFDLWWFWWRGDSLAILLVTPFLLVWFSGQPEWRRAKVWEAVVAFAVLLTSSLLVFGLLFPGATFSPPGAFVHFPVLIWVAMRLGLHGATTANVLLLAITGWGTVLGQGPLARPTLEATLVLHWAFLGATSLSSLILAAAVREQRTTREALEQSDERYRDFMEQSPDGIWRIELEKPLSLGLPVEQQLQHLIRYSFLAECNDAFARMRGFANGREMAGQPIDKFLPPTDEHNLEVFRDLIRAGYRGQQRETHEVDRQGHPKYFLSNIVGIIEKGKLARIWGTQRDVTEHRALEEQLRQAQKMEAVGRLAGGVAHDFNNLLMVIGGYGELLRDEMQAHPAITKHVDAILKAADRAGALTRQLLAFGRKQVLKPKVLDVNAVVQETSKLLRRLIGEHIELSLSLHPLTGRVKADPGQLEQVLMNLAINARDAMLDGGKLSIETGNVQLGEDFAREHPAVAPGDYVLLSVADTGTGMDEKTRSQVFEPFFTTKERGQGTGLGLATVYGIVRQSGGYVWAQSALGSGSTFRVYLPRVLESADLDAQGGVEPFARGAETILVAEDELDVRALACTFLRGQGYTVLEGLDPLHALKLAQENLGQLRLLLTDVVMPGMRGTELAERVVQLSPFVRVLYISGYTDQAIDNEGILDKGAHLLTKPFSREALLSRVRQVLDEQTGPGEELRVPGKAPTV